MALLLEGLDVGGDTSIEEYVISPDNDLAGNQDHEEVKDRIKLYGAEEGQSWIAKPVAGQSTLGMASRHGSMANRSMLMDPMVTLFGSVHEKAPEMGMGSMRSMLFSNFGSMFNVSADNQPKNENWDEESLQRDEDHASDNSGNESDDNLRSPLLRHDSNAEKENQGGEQLSSVGIGGGWQLAYRKDEKSSGGVKRIYLHQEGGGAAASRRGSLLSVAGGDGPADGGDLVHAAALVSHSVLRADDVMSHQSIGLATEKQPKAAASAKGPSWRDLFEPGVKHALIVGVGLQILQQVKKPSNILCILIAFAASYYTVMDYIYRTFSFFLLLFLGTCFLSRFMKLASFTVKTIGTSFRLFSGELLGNPSP